MIHIDLPSEEASILSDVLQIDISDLSMEIADTDRLDYREGLKKRKRVLERVVQAIAEAGTD